MRKFDIGIIGAGAAGMVAAISARRKGRSVVLCDRMETIGKKLLATGAGRCNLCNDELAVAAYNDEAQELVGSIFSRFGKQPLLDLFQSLGLYVYSQQGRLFPVTNQASSVLAVLEQELGRLGVELEPGFEVEGIVRSGEGFQLTSRHDKKLGCEKLVLATGGTSYPALGSNGSGYAFARQFGHCIIEPVPSAVPLQVKDPRCHILQGQKIFVCARAVINGTIASKADGELLFTRYGLSGTAVLDISQEISVALNRRKLKDVVVCVDLVPFLKEDALRSELARRVETEWDTRRLLTGILPEKCNRACADILVSRDPALIARALKDCRFRVYATRGWNEAEFTAGGVETAGVLPGTLESRFTKGLYLCGELLDVEGRRGGYNLAWAFCSGFVAGLTE